MNASHDFDAPALFRRLGLLPQQHGFFGGSGGKPRACLLSARMLDRPDGKAKLMRILMDEHQGSVDGRLTALALELGDSEGYAYGLAVGWDGKNSRHVDSPADYLRGLADGKAAWEACRTLLDEGRACGRRARRGAGEPELVGATS